MRRRLAAALSILIVALALGGCPVGQEELEGDVREFVEERGVNVDSVACPDELDSELGAQTKCMVDVGAYDLTVDVEVIRIGGDGSDADAGNVEYRLRIEGWQQIGLGHQGQVEILSILDHHGERAHLKE
jgi:hypothetical protein